MSDRYGANERCEFRLNQVSAISGPRLVAAAPVASLVSNVPPQIRRNLGSELLMLGIALHGIPALWLLALIRPPGVALVGASRSGVVGAFTSA